MGALPESPEETQSLELLARVREGQKEAWQQLYELYHDELLFSARQKLGAKLRSALESEDILQSVALEAFRDLGHFQHRGKGSLRAFLHKLVLNKIRDRADYFAAKKRDGAVPLSDSILAELSDGQQEPRYHDDQRYLALEENLKRLPDEMREVLVLRRFRGLSSKEAAEELGRSDAATRKLYSRALAKLSLLMGAEGA